MKPLLAAFAMAVLVVGGIVFLWPVQQVGSEPINYGRDTCAHCRMHLSRPGFAGELRDRTGSLAKYDDIGCMLRAMLAIHQEVPEAWVEDHSSQNLIPLLRATLVRAPGVETPMGDGIVAFEDASSAEEFARQHSGEVIRIEDVLREPTRFVSDRNGRHGNRPQPDS